MWSSQQSKSRSSDFICTNQTHASSTLSTWLTRISCKFVIDIKYGLFASACVLVHPLTPGSTKLYLSISNGCAKLIPVILSYASQASDGAFMCNTDLPWSRVGHPFWGTNRCTRLCFNIQAFIHLVNVKIVFILIKLIDEILLVYEEYISFTSKNNQA